MPSPLAPRTAKTTVSGGLGYYPFGMMQEGRQFVGGMGYRYGFGSQEKIDEVSGSGNTVDMGDRWLDVRLGRTPKMDSKAHLYSGISPYAYALNTPILAYDPDGSIVVFANNKTKRDFNRLYKAADSETKARLDVLKSSEVIYNVNTKASLSGRQGSSQYNFNTGQFDVLVDKKTSNQIGSLGDELTHAHQFETGNLGYILNNNGQVGTLGYDMEDEVASKRGEISATQSVNAAEGTSLPLDNTTLAFQKSDTDPVPDGMTRNQMIENYFKTDPSAQQYLQILDPRGTRMGVNITGSGGYTEGQLKGAVQSGQFKDFIYREKQPNGSTKTIRGSGN
jgi:RHS repeat-associated protein